MEQQFDKIYMVTEIPKKLKMWWESFTKQETIVLEGKLGRMVDLLYYVTPNRDLVQALVPFWCPTRAVFKFKDFELTPTLGEIVGITGLKCQGREMIFPTYHGGKKFQQKLGLNRDNRLGCIDNDWVHLDYLYTRFGNRWGHRDFRPEFACSKETWEERRVRAFVVAFLGAIVFPEEEGHIRTCIGSVVHVMFDGTDGNKSTTIVPMILAEMYRALNECKRGSKYFQGCNLLLQVWAIEQVCRREDRRVDIFYVGDLTGTVNPIVTQNNRTKRFEKPKSFQGWFDLLAHLTDKEVMWTLSYVPNEETVLRTPGQYYIELAGLTGLQPYAPLRVLRQFGIEQVIPLYADMSKSEVTFMLKGGIPRKEEICTVWRNLRPVEVSKRHQSCTPEYLAWIKEERRLGPSPPGRVGYEDTDMTKKMKYARAETSHDETSAPTGKKMKQARM